MMLFSPWQYYGVFGLHDSANDGVTMAMRPARAQTVVSQNGTWEQGWNHDAPPSQARIADWLRTRVDTIYMTGYPGFFGYTADNFYNAAGQTIGQQASLVSFSTALASGSALVNVAIVPEPATLVFATLAGAVLLPRRRRAPA